jgi:hypothetical protein
MFFRDGSDKGTASNFVQISENVTETLAMIGQVFGKESMCHTQKAQTHQDQKKKKKEKGETGEEQSQEHDVMWCHYLGFPRQFMIRYIIPFLLFQCASYWLSYNTLMNEWWIYAINIGKGSRRT